MKNGKFLKIFTFTISIVLSIAFLVAPVNASLVFSDLMAEHWCYDKIIDFEQKGFVCGYEDGTFRPDQTITRAEYVKIVNNFFGYELEYDKDSGFSDINSGDWFIPYVNEAAERGYITGYEDGTFRPEEPIRRQEATVILSRILGIDEEEYPADHEDGLAQYSDGEEVEDWARVAIHSYSVYNFINGYEDGSLRILQDVTRAETVELLHILEQQIVIPEDNKGGNGGGGGSSKRADSPVITIYEKVNGEKSIVKENAWVNYETKYEKDSLAGALVEIETKTEGAKTYYVVNENGWQNKVEFVEPFILSDGIYEVKALSSKTGYKNSNSVATNVKVDTVAPIANGLHEENLITISVEDYNYYEIASEQLSGVSGDSLRYAWFIYDDVKEDYVRETVWYEFENNQTIEIPEFEGAYYLGVKGSDVAGNKMGTGILDGVIADVDDEVDFPNTDEDEEPTEDPFIIINEIGKSYVLNVFSGDNISSVIGSGEYEYRSQVTVGATLVDDEGKYYEFLGWTGDTDKIPNFNKAKNSQSFKMPATNLTLTAHAVEMKVALDLKVVSFSGDKTKDAPEPGDWIEYELSVENQSNKKDIDLILELFARESGDISGDNTVEITVEKDDTEKIRFTAQMTEDFDVYGQFFVDVVARPEKNTDVKLDEISLGTYTEKMSDVRYKQRTNKNIVMLIDTSASMGFCTDHPELSTKDYYGYVLLYEEIRNGNFIDENGIVKELGYDEDGDLIFSGDGELILEYDKPASGPYKGHLYKKENSEEYELCTALSRMDVLVNALVSENGFIETIAKGAEKNEEEVTITIVTFSGPHEETGEWLAANQGTFTLNNDHDEVNLKEKIRNLKYEFHSGTYINTGLSEVVNVFEDEEASDALLSDNTVENYFIFFGDGKVSSESADERSNLIDVLIADENAYFDYSYAIGFGKDFVSGSDSYNLLKALLKDSKNEEPIHAKGAGDIVKAFESIARSISATQQTENGKLILSGISFDEAVENGKVFPIAVKDGEDELFRITSISNTEVKWNNDTITTNIKFEKEDDILKEIIIDLSGTAFSDKKELTIVFDAPEEQE